MIKRTVLKFIFVTELIHEMLTVILKIRTTTKMRRRMRRKMATRKRTKRRTTTRRRMRTQRTQRRRLIVIMTKAIATGRPSSRLRRVDPTSFSLLHRSKRLSLTPEIRFVFVFPQIKTLIVYPSNNICNCVCVHTLTPLSTQNLWCLTQTPKLFPLQSPWCFAPTPRFRIHGDGC